MIKIRLHFFKTGFGQKTILATIIIILSVSFRLGFIKTSQNLIDMWFSISLLYILKIIYDLVLFMEKSFFPTFFQKITYCKMPEIYKKLASKMKVNVPKFGYSEYFENAAYARGKLIIGKPLEKILNKDEMVAIVAHEFSHKKNAVKQFFLIFIGALIVALWIISLTYHPSYITLIVNISAFFYLFWFPFLWLREFDSDITAIKYVEIKNFECSNNDK